MEKTNNLIVNNAVYGIFDNFENKLRMGFASKNIKKLAIEVAEEVVEKATVDGELAFGEFKDKAILFKDALEIFGTHGFTLAIVPNYMEALLKEGISTVVSTSSDAFFDGSNEGVKLLKFHYKSGAKVMLIFDLTKKSPDFLIRTLTYTLNQKSISIFISLELRASSLSFSVLFSSGMSSHSTAIAPFSRAVGIYA